MKGGGISMNYVKFTKVINELQKQDKIISKLYKLKVDLIDFSDGYQQIIAELFLEIYGKEGYDWITWFCYEGDFGQKKLEAWDKDNNPICYDVKSLWQYLETLK